MARTRSRRGANHSRRKAAAPPDSSPAMSGVLSRSAVFHLVALVIIVLAMSPVTRNLDNIKMALYLALGPAILAGVLAEASAHRIAPPPISLLSGWGAWLLVALISTLFSAYRWAGLPELAFLWASFGFCMGGFAHGLTSRGIRVFLISMTGLLLVVNLFGFIQFDLFGTGTTGITLFQRMVGGPGEFSDTDSALQTLLHTFATRASTSLMSTVLNRDFYAAFCLLFLGFPLALGLLARRPGIKAFGFTTVGLSVLSILLCQSKGEYIALGASTLLFCSLMLLAGFRPSLKGRGYAGAWLIGSILLIATVLLVKFPVVGEQLKSLEDSFRARLIIYRGAVDIFREFPILGGGPGTFKIYFPGFRSPDYFEWGISNVTNFSHNYFLDALSETGFIGLAALLGLLLPVVFVSVRLVLTDDDRLRVIPAAAALACACGFLVSNLTSVSARWPIGAVGFWSVIGFLAGLSRGSAGDDEVKGKSTRIVTSTRDRRVVLVFLAVSVVLLPFSLSAAVSYWRSQKVFADGYLLAEQYRNFAIQAIYGGQQLKPEQESLLVGKLNEAAESLKAATQIDPSLLTAYYHLGSTESLLSGLEPEKKEAHLRAALDAFDELSRLAPDYAELPYNLGIVHYQYALNIEQAIQIVPPGSTELKAQLESELVEHQAKALENFERMGELSNRAEVLLNLGESYARVGRPDRALDVYRRGMELYSMNAKFPERLLVTGLLAADAEAIIEAQLALWRLNPLDLALVLGPEGALSRLLALDRPDAFWKTAEDIESRIPVDERLYAWRARAAARWNSPEAVRAELDFYRRLGGSDRAVLNLARPDNEA